MQDTLKRLIAEGDASIDSIRRGKRNCSKDVFFNARKSFFLNDQTSYLMNGFHSLLAISIPSVIGNDDTISIVLNGLKYCFSLKNIKVFNSGFTTSECFKHGLSSRVPITADFQFDVVPLLADGIQKPTILSKVRSVVFQHPICTGRSPLWTGALEDPVPEDDGIYTGIYVCNGRMRYIPPVKSMVEDEKLLSETKKCFRLQVRSAHQGNRSAEDAKPFRSTSSINFEVSKTIKRATFEGTITCKLPFSRQQVHISTLAQAFGCPPTRFVELIRSVAGKDYDMPIFRCYEIDILHHTAEVSTQEEAVLVLAKLANNNKTTTTTTATNATSTVTTSSTSTNQISNNHRCTPSSGMNLLKTEIFPHLNIMFPKGNQEGLYLMKLMYLASCTALLILFVAGKVKETSRDLWQYANMTMPVYQLGAYIRSIYLMHMQGLAKSLRRTLQNMFKRPIEKQTYPNLVTIFGEWRLSDKIMSGVLTGKFSKAKIGVTMSFNDHNEKYMIAQLSRLSSSMRKTNSTQVNPRKVHHDSWGYPCAASAVDGHQVGLVNEKASTSTITTDLEDPKALCDLLELLLKPYLINILDALLKPKPKLGTESTNYTTNHNTDNHITKSNSTTTTATTTIAPLQSAVSSLSIELLNKIDFDQKDPEWYSYINNCGVPTHFVQPQHVSTLVHIFREARRNGDIPCHTFIRLSNKPREIRVYAGGGQMTRPLIVLSNLGKVKPFMTFDDMVHAGIIEYVNAAEEQSLCKTVICLADLKYAIQHNEHHDLTHMEFTQTSFVGIIAASVVYMTGIEGPRLAYAIQQKRQIIEAGPKRFRGAISNTEMWYSHANLVQTECASLTPHMTNGSGTPNMTMVLALSKNQEDAFIDSLYASQRGAHTVSTTRHYCSEIRGKTTALSERFEKPANTVLSCKMLSYNAIGPNGFSKRGVRINGGEVVQAKTRAAKRTTTKISQPITSATAATSKPLEQKQQEEGITPPITEQPLMNIGGNGGGRKRKIDSNNSSSSTSFKQTRTTRKCVSLTTKQDEGGTVTNVTITHTPNGKRGRTSISSTRHMKNGNKSSNDQSQKGVCGEMQLEEDMHFDEVTGMVPNRIVSPLGFISRKTMSSMVQMVVEKAIAASGDLSLGFDKQQYEEVMDLIIKAAGEELVKKGFRRNGTATFRSGKTGKKIVCDVFCGFTYDSVLNHIAERKLQFRSVGPCDPMTRQARQGKCNDGGLRFGELEVASLTAQGGAAMLQSRLNYGSDPFQVFYCSKCKGTADGNLKINYAWCRKCKDRTYVHQVRPPYSFHLHKQELAATGIKVLPIIKTVKM